MSYRSPRMRQGSLRGAAFYDPPRPPSEVIEPFGTSLGNFTNATLFDADVGQLRRVPGRSYVMGGCDLTISTDHMRFISPALTLLGQWVSGGPSPGYPLAAGYRSMYGTENFLASCGRYDAGNGGLALLPNDGVTFGTEIWEITDPPFDSMNQSTKHSCAISPDETKIAVCTNTTSPVTARITIYDIDGTTELQTYAGDTASNHSAVEWVADGTRLIIGVGSSTGVNLLELYDADDLAAGALDSYDMNSEPPTHPTTTSAGQELHTDPLNDSHFWFVPGINKDPVFYKFDVSGDTITLLVEKDVSADSPLTGTLRTWSLALDRTGHLYCPLYMTSGAAESDVARYDNDGTFIYSARTLGVTGLPAGSGDQVQAIAVGDAGHVFLGTSAQKVYVAEQL